MSLLSTYTQFLASPTSSVLAHDASINYIPTLTTINEPAGVIKHLAAQAKVLTKKSEKVISSVEGQHSLCIEFGTTIEFLTGGGALLPGLDDNFLTDKIVVLPMIHVVDFNPQGKVRHIRIYWDQGSLLKNIDVIGSRGRNWPIRDGKDQIRLMSSNTGAEPQSTANSRRSTASSNVTSTSATGDPHATLSLFKSHDAQAQDKTPRKNSVGIAPRSSARPPTRDLTDILSGTEKDVSFQPGSPSMRPPSPRKNTNGGAPKGGAGKNYHDIRLFENNDLLESQKSPDKKVNPLKYNHFDFGDGEQAPEAKTQAEKSKHASQWNFEDFVTPDKPRMKVQTHNKKNFGWSDDEEAEKSPIQRPIVHAARPDAEHHFEFVDDGTPAAQKDKQPVIGGRAHNAGVGLYKNNVIEDSEGGEDPETVKQPLTTLTNVNLDNRHKDFDSQFDMIDDSPSVKRTIGAPAKTVDPNQARVIKGLDASWGMYDNSPDTKKENRQRGIKLGGDGMGGHKGQNRHWGFGDDSDPEEGHSRPIWKERGNSTNAASSKSAEVKGFWEF